MYTIKDKDAILDPLQDLVTHLKTRFKGQCGIIYCLRRDECKDLARTLLRKHKINCGFYHGGM